MTSSYNEENEKRSAPNARSTENSQPKEDSQVKVNLLNGTYLTRTDHQYLSSGREGNECGARCPRWPHYRCTRDKGHGQGTKSKDTDLDHAAHGWSKGVGIGAVRRLIVMYARWSR